MKTSNMPPSDMKALHGLSLKVLGFDDAQGEIEAIVSVFNNSDRAEEMIPFGACKNSLAKKLPKGVWGHDWLQPIAKTLVAKELPPGDPLLTKENQQLGGLYIKGQFNLETQRGRESYSDIKMGIVDEFSIGYRVVKSSISEGVTVLEEIELYEWSPVLVGCNPATSLVSIKSDMPKTTKTPAAKDLSQLVHFKGDYLGENIESSLAYGALSDLGNSLGWAFYSIIYGAGTPEDKILQVSEACDEFKSIAIKVVTAVLAEDATEDAIEKAFEGICRKAFGPVELKEGRTFSAATKEAIGEKVKAFKVIAKSLTGHANDIAGMMDKTDAPDTSSEGEGVHLVEAGSDGETGKAIVGIEIKSAETVLSEQAISEIALLELSILEAELA